MSNKSLLSMLKPRFLAMYIILFAFAFISLKYDRTLGITEFAVVILLIVLQKIFGMGRNKKINEYLEQLLMTSDSITKNFVAENPLPLAVIKETGDIIWYNEEFADKFKIKELEFENIENVIPDFPRIKFDSKHKDIDIVVSYGENIYHVIGSTEKMSDSSFKYISLLNFVDITEKTQLAKRLDDTHTVYGTVMIDNFDECINGISEANRSVLAAETDRHIFSWAQEVNSVIIKIERNKYIIMFEKQNLEAYLKEGFIKLRNLPESQIKSNIPLTFSIGIGTGGQNLSENESFSQAAIDMALGRGGDQVVVKDETDFTFYGGFSKEIEKRTKVRARVVARALQELIEQKDNIVVVGHKNADMDLVGSAMGIYRACATYGKKCYIMLEEINPSISDICDRIKEKYEDIFINKYHADSMLANNGMLIILDTHIKGLLAYPDMLNYTETIVLIDHHRKSPDFIGNTTLLYHEPYASSTCELVIEVLQYFNKKVEMTSVECEAMYAGMLIDTKNFTFKTGVRTFEAASYLRRAGLNTVAAKDLVKCDLDTYVIRNEIINNAAIYKGNIAISRYENSKLKDTVVVAQAADELLNIRGITTAFVLYFDGITCQISARSIGDINVQIIMEKLGGGGHQLAAATQIKSTDTEGVRLQLIEAIDNYFENNKKSDNNGKE